MPAYRVNLSPTIDLPSWAASNPSHGSLNLGGRMGSCLHQFGVCLCFCLFVCSKISFYGPKLAWNSLCTPGWLSIHNNPPASPSQVPGLPVRVCLWSEMTTEPVQNLLANVLLSHPIWRAVVHNYPVVLWNTPWVSWNSSLYGPVVLQLCNVYAIEITTKYANWRTNQTAISDAYSLWGGSKILWTQTSVCFPTLVRLWFHQRSCDMRIQFRDGARLGWHLSICLSACLLAA